MKLTPMFTTPDACHNGSYQGSMCTCVREGGFQKPLRAVRSTKSETITSCEAH